MIGSQTPTRLWSRRGLRAGLVLGLALLLSGCIKYDLRVLVNDDDTMDGALIVGIAREFAAGENVFGQSEELTPSVGTITKEAYEDEDYIGTRYVIDGVPISEIDVLSTDSSTRFSLTRQGAELTLDASLRFSLGSDAAPTNTGFTAMVSFTFPGQVLESNGAIDGNTVTWPELRQDADNNLTARASAISNGAADGALGSGIPWWVWVLGGIGVLAVIGIVAAVLVRRRRAATAAAATAAAASWPGQPPGGYDEYGNPVPSTGYVQPTGYYDPAPGGGDDSYYGTYGGAYSENYGGAYGENYAGAYGENYGGPHGENYGGAYGESYGGPPSGGYSGQTVVGRPNTLLPPDASRGT